MSDVSLANAPDPEALGKIRNIVASAHKWGGNGTEPKFRKIREVLMRKHPEVIARAFGGNANVAAAWIKNNWYRMRGMDPPSTRKRRVKMALSRYQEVPAEFFDGGAEMFAAGYDPQREGNLVWVTALREGEWKVNPIPRRKGPLVVDRQFMEDVMQAWREHAWEFVTVPTYHTDTDVMANTGFVRDLKIAPDPDRPGQSVLRAAVEFTEPDVQDRVLRGSIAGVSVNVKFGVRHQESGKLFNKVMTHLALTNIPFVNGLRAFDRKLAASNGEAFPDEDVQVSYELEGDDDIWLALADAWDPERDLSYVREQIDALLQGSFALDDEGDIHDMRAGTGTDLAPAYVHVMGMTDDAVLLTAHVGNPDYTSGTEVMSVRDHNGECEGWVAHYSVDPEGEVVLDPVDEWTKVRKAWMEMSREFTLIDELPISGGEDGLSLRNFSEDERKRLADSGKALPDGSFPIVTVGDLRNAISAFGRAGNKAAAKRHIIKRAKALGRTDLLPEEWSASLEELMDTTESPRGGDGSMADENQETPTPGTEETPAPAPAGDASFTREDLDRIADERAQAALDSYRQEQEQMQAARDAELAAARSRLHEMAVRERVAELETAGHAPAVIATAREIMLADERGEPVLSLSREDGEVSLSATEIVMTVLDALPPTALSMHEVIVDSKTNNANNGDVSARADRIESFIKGE